MTSTDHKPPLDLQEPNTIYDQKREKNLFFSSTTFYSWQSFDFTNFKLDKVAPQKSMKKSTKESVLFIIGCNIRLLTLKAFCSICKIVQPSESVKVEIFLSKLEVGVFAPGSTTTAV